MFAGSDSKQRNKSRTRSCITMSRNLVEKGGFGTTTKAGGLTRSLAPRQKREEVEYIRRRKMYTRVPREVNLRET